MRLTILQILQSIGIVLSSLSLLMRLALFYVLVTLAALRAPLRRRRQ